MDDSRYRPQLSPRNEPRIGAFVSPPRNGGSQQLPQQQQQHHGFSHEARSVLPRRFTTDSSRTPRFPSALTSPTRFGEPSSAQEYNDVSSDLGPVSSRSAWAVKYNIGTMADFVSSRRNGRKYNLYVLFPSNTDSGIPPSITLVSPVERYVSDNNRTTP